MYLPSRFATKWMSRRERHEKLGNQPKKFTNVYVKNFGEDMDEERFKELTEKSGKVLSLKVVLSDSGRSRGFGFVSYETPEEAQKVCSECLAAWMMLLVAPELGHVTRKHGLICYQT